MVHLTVSTIQKNPQDLRTEVTIGAAEPGGIENTCARCGMCVSNLNTLV